MAFPDVARLRVPLPDGRFLILRPVTPADGPMLERGLETLSLQSRLTRFFAPLPHLSPQQLDYLTNVDQRGHVAWGALIDGEELVGIGIGRFARLADEPDLAAAAVTVLDAFQRQGVGRLLLALLYRAAQQLGLRGFRAYVLLSNEHLIRSLQALGGRIVSHQDGAGEIEIPIAASDEELPDSPAGNELRSALATIEEAIREAEA
jgi:ribosomal protein S18 acetylase RimI-like enzyme